MNKKISAGSKSMMPNFQTWRYGWQLLSASERRQAFIVLAIIVVAGLSSAGMVGSIIPFLTVLSAPAKIETNTYLSWAYQSFGFTSAHGFLVALGLGSILVIIFASLLQIVRVWAVSYFAQSRIFSLSTRLLRTYLAQPYEFFLGQHTGEMGTKILAECQTVVGQFYRPAANIIASLFSVMAILGMLVWLYPLITIVCLSALGIFYGSVFVAVQRRLTELGKIRMSNNKLRFRIANEALGGIKDIKLLGREANYFERYSGPTKEVTKTQIYFTVISEVPGYFIQGFAFSGIIILSLILLGQADLNEDEALGGLIPLLGVFAFAGQRMIPELQRIYLGFTSLQYGNAALLALHRDLSPLTTAQELPPTATSAMGLKKHIEFVDVTYRYPNTKTTGLTHISFEISAGEKIGVVGSTGAGKTTLADLLLGLISPETGKIRVDGVDITPNTKRAWQKTVGYVPQDIFLIDATVTENIGLGLPKESIDPVRVNKACRIAQLDAFIESELPHGYETMIGERGIRLSGGQRQRIGIARALYHDADLIVFDEATSALDNLTESDVMTSIQALPGDKTIVLIAHRLSTVKLCDRILVLDKGRVVGIGSWDELEASNKIFRKLTQFDEVI